MALTTRATIDKRFGQGGSFVDGDLSKSGSLAAVLNNFYAVLGELQDRADPDNYKYTRISGMASGSAFTVTGMAVGDEILAAHRVSDGTAVSASILTPASGSVTWGSNSHSASAVCLFWRDVT